MSDQFCPGAKMIRRPKPEIFTCPQCGDEVEIWSDELRGTCASCGMTVLKDGTASCLDWCKFGKECVGEESYNTYMRNKAEGLREKLLVFAEKQLSKAPAADSGNHLKRVKRLLKEAEKLLRKQQQNEPKATAEKSAAEWHIVIPAVILSGIPEKVLTTDAVTTLLISYGLQEEHAVRIARLIDFDRPLPSETEADTANRNLLESVLSTFIT